MSRPITLFSHSNILLLLPVLTYDTHTPDTHEINISVQDCSVSPQSDVEITSCVCGNNSIGLIHKYSIKTKELHRYCCRLISQISAANHWSVYELTLPQTSILQSMVFTVIAISNHIQTIIITKSKPENFWLFGFPN